MDTKRLESSQYFTRSLELVLTVNRAQEDFKNEDWINTPTLPQVRAGIMHDLAIYEGNSEALDSFDLKFTPSGVRKSFGSLCYPHHTFYKNDQLVFRRYYGILLL